MKISVNRPNTGKPRPRYAAVGLDAEAYDILLRLADEHGLSMRAVASAIIVSAYREGIAIDIK